MAREKGKIEAVLSTLLHHLGDRKADQLWGGQFPADRVPIRDVQYRFNIVGEPLSVIEDQIKRLRVAVDAGDLDAVRSILNEEIEYGHDFERLHRDDASVGTVALFERQS